MREAAVESTKRNFQTFFLNYDQRGETIAAKRLCRALINDSDVIRKASITLPDPTQLNSTQFNWPVELS
jgi:hypothetical protein